MSIKSEAGIYKVLEDLLKATDDANPLTCVDLFNNPKVRKFAPDANKVSDFLGHMWRRGLLQRWYAPKDSRAKARYAYTWKNEDVNTPSSVPVDRIGVVPGRYASKPNVTITESEHSIILDFPQFTITVQSKQKD